MKVCKLERGISSPKMQSPFYELLCWQMIVDSIITFDSWGLMLLVTLVFDKSKCNGESVLVQHNRQHSVSPGSQHWVFSVRSVPCTRAAEKMELITPEWDSNDRYMMFFTSMLLIFIIISAVSHFFAFSLFWELHGKASLLLLGAADSEVNVCFTGVCWACSQRSCCSRQWILWRKYLSIQLLFLLSFSLAGHSTCFSSV